MTVNQAGASLPFPELTVTGTGQDSLNLQDGSYAFAPGDLPSGTVSLSLVSSTVSLTGDVSLAGLSLDASSRVTMTVSTGAADLFSVGSISLNGGTLDLTNNDLVIHATATTAQTTLSQINQAVAEGCDKSTWLGAGITSSTAGVDPQHLSALGVMLNSADGTAPIFSRLAGEPLTASDILVRSTLYGDANLDGVVDGSDYSRIDNASLLGLTGWQNGDFNYDASINGSDYTLIDNARNTQGAPRTNLFRNDFDAASAASVVFGDVDTTPTQAPPGSGANQCITFQPGHGEIDFSFIGQECDLFVDSNVTNPITVTADGVTTTPAFTPGTFTWIPLESQAVDDGSTQHTISITTIAGDGWELGVDPRESIRVTSLAAPPSIGFAPGFGPSFSLGDDPDFVQLAAGYSVGMQGDGSYGAFNNTYSDSAVSFTARTSSIELYTYQGTGCVDVTANGVVQVQYQITTRGWNTIAAGLDSSRMVNYRLSESNNVWGQVNYPQIVIFSNLMFPGGIYSAATMPTPVRVVCVGDSITLGAQDLGTTAYGYPVDLENLNSNVLVTDMGYSGSTLTTGAGDYAGGYRDAATIAGFTIKPDIIVMEYGTNDMAYGIDPSTFEGAYAYTLSLMLANDLTAGGKIYCLGLLPRTAPANPAFDQATSDEYSDAVQQAVESVNNPSVTYTRAYSWLTEPDDYLPDGTHPNYLGYQILADQIQNLLFGG